MNLDSVILIGKEESINFRTHLVYHPWQIDSYIFMFKEILILTKSIVNSAIDILMSDMRLRRFEKESETIIEKVYKYLLD